MFLQRFTHYLFKHFFIALALTFIITFIPILGILGVLVAGLMTLTRGFAVGAIFTLAATLPYFISFFFTGTHQATLPLVFWAAISVAVFSNVLTWLFAGMLRRQTTWSALIQIAALMGVLTVSIIHLVYPQVSEWWGLQLQAYYSQASSAMLRSNLIVSPETQAQTIQFTKQYATGLFTAAILFNAMMQLIVARWWQCIIYNPGGLQRELHNLRLSTLAGLLFVASLILSFFGNRVVVDMMPITYMLFAAAGLSVIHYLFALKNAASNWVWLTILYIALIILLPTSVGLLSIVALIDVWMNLRKRFKTA